MAWHVVAWCGARLGVELAKVKRCGVDSCGAVWSGVEQCSVARCGAVWGGVELSDVV